MSRLGQPPAQGQREHRDGVDDASLQAAQHEAHPAAEDTRTPDGARRQYALGRELQSARDPDDRAQDQAQDDRVGWTRRPPRSL